MLAEILKANGHELAFNLLDVGALPLDGEPDPYHRLLKAFPSSRLTGFELDAELCARLNSKAAPGVRYHCCALGRTEEKRTLYNAMHPMCTSLYPPDERLPDIFGTFDVMRLKSTSEITTQSLDKFAREQTLAPVDFIKIDVQGAELEIFEGGTQTLREVMMIVCEVEFIPLYRGQPLFGDVDTWMRRHGMMLRSFLGLGGRVMKPLAFNGSTQYPAQCMWTDAVYVRDLFALERCSTEQLLKLALLAECYDSQDVALYVLRQYDAREDDDLADIYVEQLARGGQWKVVGGERPDETQPES